MNGRPPPPRRDPPPDAHQPRASYPPPQAQYYAPPEYPQPSYPPQQAGYPQQPSGYPPQQPQQPGYPQAQHPSLQPANANYQPTPGYPPQGYPAQGYPAQGYADTQQPQPAEEEPSKAMAVIGDLGELASRLPALGKLGLKNPAWYVPLVLQTSMANCGAACLTMVLHHHGKMLPLEEVERNFDIGRDGTTARSIVEGATLYNLLGRGIRIEPEQFEQLTPATILHWGLNHYVVFERLTDKGMVELVNPATGRQTLSLAEVSREFTGVALVFEKGEGFTQERSKKKPLARYLERTLKDSTGLGKIAVTTLLLQLVGFVLPLVHGRIVDRVIPRNDQHLLAVLVVGLIGVLAFDFLATLIRSQLLLHLRTKLDVRMTVGFLEHMLRLPYAFFQKRKAGDLMMRLNSNATIREMLTSSLLSVVIDSVLVVGYFAFLILMSPMMAGLALLLVFVQSALFFAMRKKQQELASGSLLKQAESESYLVETLEGIETLKSMGSEHKAVEHWSNLYVDVMNISMRRGAMTAWSDAVLGTVRTAGPLLLLMVGTAQVMRGELGLGTMLSATSFANSFIGPLNALVGLFTQFQVIGSYLGRIEDVLQTPTEQDGKELRNAPRFKGGIRLDRVNFRYSAKAPLVLRDVSVTIKPGQMIAVVGRSGSGKSTMASLLLGMYPPTGGALLYDGHNLAELDLRSVRRQFGIVVQKPYLFAASVRDNIALGAPEANLEDVQNACKLAWVHDDVVAMPMGYDTPLIAGGGSLSGGQRQRLALARAIVRKPSILLLDEATSALDTMTEQRVHAELQRLGCTRVVIAHRLSTVVGADVILVMDKGSLVEQGTHAELVAKKGIYAQLVAAQMQGQGPAQGQAAQGQAAQGQAAQGQTAGASKAPPAAGSTGETHALPITTKSVEVVSVGPAPAKSVAPAANKPAAAQTKPAASQAPAASKAPAGASKPPAANKTAPTGETQAVAAAKPAQAKPAVKASVAPPPAAPKDSAPPADRDNVLPLKRSVPPKE
jgi:ATP-binding cassette, subfamily B, bacterial